jgi:hypothetical protein
MSPELQRQHENTDAHTMIILLKELFDNASRIEMYKIFKELFHCKMTKGSLMNTHVLKMIGYIEKLGELDFVIDHELGVELVLLSLPQNFSQFIINYHMNKLDSILLELFNILKTVEGPLRKKKTQFL